MITLSICPCLLWTIYSQSIDILQTNLKRWREITVTVQVLKKEKKNVLYLLNLNLLQKRLMLCYVITKLRAVNEHILDCCLPAVALRLKIFRPRGQALNCSDLVKVMYLTITHGNGTEHYSLYGQFVTIKSYDCHFHQD